MVNRKKQKGRERNKQATQRAVPSQESTHVGKNEADNRFFERYYRWDALVNKPSLTTEEHQEIVHETLSIVEDYPGPWPMDRGDNLRMNFYRVIGLIFYDGFFRVGEVEFVVGYTDQEKGLLWLEKAAHLGDELSMATIMDVAMEKSETDVNAEEMVEYWGEKLVECGDRDVAMQLACRYVSSPPLRNVAKSIKWLVAADTLGSKEADCNLRLLQYARDESCVLETAFSYLDELWESGKKKYYISILITHMEEDWVSLAIRGYELIYAYSQRHYGDTKWPADRSDSVRVTFLSAYGFCLCDPPDAPRDVNKGIRIFEQVYSLGYKGAATKLTDLYKHNYPEIQNNDEKLVYWLDKSMELGADSKDALILAGYFLNHAETSPTHPWLARKWAKKAAKLGNKDAEAMVNECSNPSCDFCDPTGKSFKKCKSCKLRLYCSRECQLAHWKNGHKQECCTLQQGREEYDAKKQEGRRTENSIDGVTED